MNPPTYQPMPMIGISHSGHDGTLEEVPKSSVRHGPKLCLDDFHIGQGQAEEAQGSNANTQISLGDEVGMTDCFRLIPAVNTNRMGLGVSNETV